MLARGSEFDGCGTVGQTIVLCRLSGMRPRRAQFYENLVGAILAWLSPIFDAARFCERHR